MLLPGLGEVMSAVGRLRRDSLKANGCEFSQRATCHIPRNKHHSPRLGDSSQGIMSPKNLYCEVLIPSASENRVITHVLS